MAYNMNLIKGITLILGVLLAIPFVFACDSDGNGINDVPDLATAKMLEAYAPISVHDCSCDPWNRSRTDLDTNGSIDFPECQLWQSEEFCNCVDMNDDGNITFEEAGLIHNSTLNQLAGYFGVYPRTDGILIRVNTISCTDGTITLTGNGAQFYHTDGINPPFEQTVSYPAGDMNLNIRGELNCTGEGTIYITIVSTTDADNDGFIKDWQDCDDNNPNVHPNTGLNPGDPNYVVDICDGVDNDCDYWSTGRWDEDDPNPVYQDYYLDWDRDGYGDTSGSVWSGPISMCHSYLSRDALIGGDCNDTDTSISPGTAEICDGTDNNCDGQIDEGVTTTYYMDLDNDSYGFLANTTQACSLPVNYTLNSDDCDDSNQGIHPHASDACGNGIDEDCGGGDAACPEPDSTGGGGRGHSAAGAGSYIVGGSSIKKSAVTTTTPAATPVPMANTAANAPAPQAPAATPAPMAPVTGSAVQDSAGSSMLLKGVGIVFWVAALGMFVSIITAYMKRRPSVY